MSRTLALLCAVAIGSGAIAKTNEPRGGEVRGKAGIYLSELAINPPGTDNTLEYIEIVGPPDTPMAGMYLVVIEGDGGGAGTIDQVIPLTGAIGSNGVYLLRDSTLVLQPPPPPETTVVVRDFAPDLENGATTIVLGMATGSLPPAGTDLDADNDGVIDVEFPLDVIDAVSYQDNVTGGTQYAAGLGGTNLGSFMTFTPGMLYRLLDAHGRPHRWAGGVGTGASPGPFRLMGNAHFGFDLTGLDPAMFQFDPGRANVRLDTGACCFPDDTCTTLTRLECRAAEGGYWPGGDCATFVCPLITDYSPREIREGDVVTIEGRELTPVVDDASVVARYGSTLVPFEVIEASATQVRAVAGPIPAGAEPAVLMLHGGTGVRGAFAPAMRDVTIESPMDTWVWAAGDQPALPGPGELNLITDAEPPPMTIFGEVVEGRLVIAMDQTWPVNAEAAIWVRIRGTRNAEPFVHDLDTRVRFRCGGAARDLAERVCDAIRSALAQQSPPVMIACTPVDLKDGRFEARLSVPNGSVESGAMIVRMSAPEPQPLPPLGFSVTAYGGANLEALNPGILVQDLGSSGMDGATIALPGANVRGVNVEIDAVSLDAEGRCVQLDAWGEWNGMACRHLGRASACGGEEQSIALVADLSSIGSAMVRVDVLDSGAIVGTTTVAGGAVGTIRSIAGGTPPSLVGWGCVPARPFPGFFFEFGGRFRLTPVGSAPLVGDTVRVLAAAPSAPVEAIGLFDQTVTNPAGTSAVDVVLRGATLESACPCDLNFDEVITSQDFFTFIGCFFTDGCPDADHNRDGVVNTQDFFDFLGCFFAPPGECG